MRNSVYSNTNLTETNKSNYKIKSKIFTTNKKESRYKKMFKNYVHITNKKPSILNTVKSYKNINVRSSFKKSEKKRKYKNTIKKIRLFNDNESAVRKLIDVFFTLLFFSAFSFFKS